MVDNSDWVAWLSWDALIISSSVVIFKFIEQYNAEKRIDKTIVNLNHIEVL